MIVRVSKHIIAKPKEHQKDIYVDATGIGKGKSSYQGRSWIRFGIPIHQEVSRGHSR